MDYMHILHEDNNNGCSHSPLPVPPVRQWECRLHDKIDILHLLIFAIHFYSFFSLSSLLPAARHNKMRRKIA